MSEHARTMRARTSRAPTPIEGTEMRPGTSSPIRNGVACIRHGGWDSIVPRKYPYNTSVAALLYPAKGTVFFEDWDPAVDNLNHDVLCAGSHEIVMLPVPSLGECSIARRFGATYCARSENILARSSTGFCGSSAIFAMPSMGSQPS